MTPTTKSPPADETRERLIDLIGQLGHVGSVELKVTVSPEQHTALAGLHLDTLQGKLRQVVFFDTKELTLFKNGVVVRARRTQGAPDDTVVKLRPAVVEDLPRSVQDSPNFKVEMDVTRSSTVVSASLKGQSPAGAVMKALNGARSLEKLFSKEQRSFFAAHAPAGVGWEDLMALGPIHVVVLKYVPDDFTRKVTVEQWHFPGEVPVVELSTKSPPNDIVQVAADSIAFVQAHGLRPTGEQQPKTRKALEFFVTDHAKRT